MPGQRQSCRSRRFAGPSGKSEVAYPVVREAVPSQVGRAAKRMPPCNAARRPGFLAKPIGSWARGLQVFGCRAATRLPVFTCPCPNQRATLSGPSSVLARLEERLLLTASDGQRARALSPMWWLSSVSGPWDCQAASTRLRSGPHRGDLRATVQGSLVRTMDLVSPSPALEGLLCQ